MLALFKNSLPHLRLSMSIVASSRFSTTLTRTKVRGDFSSWIVRLQKKLNRVKTPFEKVSPHYKTEWGVLWWTWCE